MICALILAAGRSTRMGSQKLLLPVEGVPMIARITDAVLHSNVDHTLVVLGPQSELVERALAGKSVGFITNPQADGDMLSSVRCGLRNLPEGCGGVLVVLGDQPGIRPATINALVDVFRSTGCPIVVPTYKGQRGHPLLFSAAYREVILTEFDQTGLRGLLLKYAGEIAGVAVDSSAILEDIDTPADYQKQVANPQNPL